MFLFPIHSQCTCYISILLFLVCRSFSRRTMYGDASNKSAGDAMNDVNDITLTASTTLSSKLLSDLTPPVTPDNTPMSIGNSPTFKTQTPFALVHQDVNKVKQVRSSCTQRPIRSTTKTIFFAGYFDLL